MSIFKENITKFFSIESFGVEVQQEIRENIDYDNDPFLISRPKKYKTEYKQFFIGSIEYNVTSVFRKYSKKVYIPILFSKENVETLKELLEYYDNLKFKLTFIDRYKRVSTKKYHISEFINFDKIFRTEYKKLYDDTGNMIIRGYYIELYLDYNDEYEILLTQRSRFDNYIDDWRNIFLNQNAVDNLCSSDTERKCLEYIRENYKDFPVGMGSFKVLFLGDYKPDCGSCYKNHLKDAIKNILENTEKRIKDKNDYDAKIASLYSKTTYLLVENKIL